MSRPKAVKPNDFHLYDKLHTRKVRMYSGVYLTALHLLKETAEYFISVESWAFCCSTFKTKKKNLEKLDLDLPICKDEKVVKFLNENAWKDWLTKDDNPKDIENIETLAFLDRLFPDKEKFFFYELDSLVSGFCNGNFVSYDEEGNVKEPREGDISQRKYYNHKYNRFVEKTPKIQKLYDAYRATPDEPKEAKTEAYRKYSDAQRDYIYENFDMTETFKTIGENIVVAPYSYSKGTADWHKEKYGSVCSYAHAGEIYFIATDDAVFFQVNRHF